jgi:hypothetical protein
MTRRIFKKKDYMAGDGMLTSVWGSSMWHALHVISFNYPIKPSKFHEIEYRNFMLSLKYVLPCKHCRDNLTILYNEDPLTHKHMKGRTEFSLYVYKLHEKINKSLGKFSGLTYCDVRERYEHFRSRCDKNEPCVKSQYGNTPRAIIQVIPKKIRRKSLRISSACLHKKIEKNKKH